MSDIPPASPRIRPETEAEIAERKRREGAALRANLARRKAQARARAEPRAPAPPQAAEDKPCP